MGLALQIIQLITCLAPVLAEILKIIKGIQPTLDEEIPKIRKNIEESYVEEGRTKDGAVQLYVKNEIKKKVAEEGKEIPDNIINLGALIALEMSKKRSTDMMPTCPPLSPDQDRFR